MTPVAAVRRATARKPQYHTLLESVSASFAAASGQLFQTDAKGLWEAYLDNLPATVRQEHNCHACRNFINKYGGLVVVNEHGGQDTVMWGVNGPGYSDAIEALRKRVIKARITAPFYSADLTWGTPVTGPWTHMAVANPSVWRHKLLTAGQKRAAMRESYKTVVTALQEPGLGKALDEVINMLRTDSLNWSEKFIAPAEWLRKLLDRPKGRAGENLLWVAVAAAPEGYLHPRASVLWPVVEAVKAGEAFSTIKARFGAMTAPLQYQRPQVEPSMGNVKQAEEIIARLGYTKSLERRFARMEDIEQWLWRPVEVAVKEYCGVFGHLLTKVAKSEVPQVELPAQTMTWIKFTANVLGVAERVELLAPQHGSYIALTSAVHADAHTPFKWTGPLAWYVYPNGSYAHDWGVRGNVWVQVTGIAPFPAPEYLATGVILLLEGCVDTRDAGNALFPSCLCQELFPVRATIEAYSRAAKLQGRAHASACGYDLRREHCQATLRAYVSGRWTTYKIDRWD